MRLFTGIAIPPEVIATIEELVRKLKPVAPVHWSRPENLHLTLKFIGQWPEDRLPEMEAALARVPKPGPIEIRIEKLGFFPNARSPRVFWAGVQAGEGLKRLANDMDEATAALGVTNESRAYSPHLTLARIRDPGSIGTLREAAEEDAARVFGSFTASDCHLYLSKPGGGGSVYSKLATFPLEG